MPTAITGHIVPGDPTPLKRKWITQTPYGPPIQEEKVVQPTTGNAPKPIGDQQHNQVMDALKNIMVEQKSSQITEALPAHRDWR